VVLLGTIKTLHQASAAAWNWSRVAEATAKPFGAAVSAVLA